MSAPLLPRRVFLNASVASAAAIAVAPAIIPASVLGQNAPSKKIQIGQIGCGRIANEMDLPGILRQDIARVIAVCDVDSKRLSQTRQRVEKHYSAKTSSTSAVAVKAYGDYRELLKNPEIDAVAISTPDHW